MVHLLPTLLAEIKTMLLFEGRGGGNCGGSRERNICHDASAWQRLVQLMVATKTKP